MSNHSQGAHLRELITLFSAQLPLMRRVFAVCVILAFCAPFFVGTKYTVSGEVLVWAKKIQQGVTGEIIGGEGARYIPATLTDIETENNIIRSTALVQQTMADLYHDGVFEGEPSPVAKITQPIKDFLKSLLADEDADPDQDAINGLTKQALASLEVVALPGSNVITVNYESDDPELAATIVNQLMKNYLEKRQNLIVNDGIDEFFLQKKNIYKERLKLLETQKVELFNKYDVTNTQEELSLNLTAMNRETAELSQLIDQHLEANAWLAYLEEQLVTLRKTDATQVSFSFTYGGSSSATVVDSEMKNQVERISTLQSEYAAVRSAFRKDSARRTTLINQLNEQKKRLINLVENRILERSKAAKVQETLIQNKRIRLDDYKERNKELKQVAGLEAEITTELQAVNDAYFKYSQQYEEKRSENIAKVDDLASVRILSSAKMPLEPSSTKRSMVWTLGLISSVFVAIAVGLIAELTRTQVRGAQQLNQILGVPVQAVFDELDSSEGTHFSIRPREFWQWLTR